MCQGGQGRRTFIGGPKGETLRIKRSTLEDHVGTDSDDRLLLETGRTFLSLNLAVNSRQSYGGINYQLINRSRNLEFLDKDFNHFGEMLLQEVEMASGRIYSIWGDKLTRLEIQNEFYTWGILLRLLFPCVLEMFLWPEIEFHFSQCPHHDLSPLNPVIETCYHFSRNN